MIEYLELINYPSTMIFKWAKKNFLTRLKQGLKRTSLGLSSIFHGKKEIDSDLLEQLHDSLLLADVGIETTTLLMEKLQQRIKRHEVADMQALLAVLRTEMIALLQPYAKPLVIDVSAKPFVILVVGVNGAGKTTTIGKLAQHLQEQQQSVLLAAGDTFRAAAVEQLQAWGERTQIPVIAQHAGADSAAVIYDGYQAAHARKLDVLIADTAGRLHTQNNLMIELQKITRVLAKANAQAPHEVLLVLDGSAGQNSLQQARQFKTAVNVTGIAITKLDGTAKGGIIFAIATQLGLPIRFIGVGETVEDLQEFDATEFVDALLG
ncbi:MAG: signal recognition particle-docking protein FtsY [Gammaproteobacteria bacterium]|nr:signal recognition particle-docking protein FtsY [Gammaproteobacteria bacterium]